MADRITNVHLGNSGTSTEKITKVKLVSGETYFVAGIVSRLKKGDTFFYTLESGYRGYVEYVNSSHPYIRTKADNSTVDNLLNLPRF